MHLILDFDGTITPVDTTDRILSRLAPPAWDTIEREWTSGRITAARCMREQIALLDVSLAEIDAVRSPAAGWCCPCYPQPMATACRSALMMACAGLPSISES